MADNLNELKEKRVNLLIALGEEGHALARKKESRISDKIRSLSEEIKTLDIQINALTHLVDESCCPQCQVKLEPEAMFCKNCGFAVQQYRNNYVEKCNCCGQPMKEKQVFCTVCGTKSRESNLLEKVGN